MTSNEKKERRIIAKRGMIEKEIIALCVPATFDEITASLLLLIGGLDSGFNDEDGNAVKIEALHFAVEDLPAFAIERAVKGFVRGEVKGASKKKMPSAAEFREEAKRQFFRHVDFEQRQSPEPVLASDHFSKRYARGEIKVPKTVGGIPIKEIFARRNAIRQHEK